MTLTEIEKLQDKAISKGSESAFNVSIAKISKIASSDALVTSEGIAAILSLAHRANNINTHKESMSLLAKTGIAQEAHCEEAINAIVDLLKNTKLVALYSQAVNSIFEIAAARPSHFETAFNKAEPLLNALNNINNHIEAIEKIGKIGRTHKGMYHQEAMSALHRLANRDSRCNELHQEAISQIYDLNRRYGGHPAAALRYIADITGHTKQVSTYDDALGKIRQTGFENEALGHMAINALYDLTINIKDPHTLPETGIDGIIAIAERHPLYSDMALDKLPPLIKQANRIHIHISGIKAIADIAFRKSPLSEKAVRKICELTSDTSKVPIYEAAIAEVVKIAKKTPEVCPSGIKALRHCFGHVTGPQNLLDRCEAAIATLDAVAVYKLPEYKSIFREPVILEGDDLPPLLENGNDKTHTPAPADPPSEYYYKLRDWLNPEAANQDMSEQNADTSHNEAFAENTEKTNAKKRPPPAPKL